MNKKIITPIIVVIVLALLTVAIIFAPNLTEMVLRMHGMR
jgi:flagellar basal body-associated protein FliL